MTPYDPSAEENVNDTVIRAGMKSLEGKYPVTVRYEKFDRAPYDPEAAVAEFEREFNDGKERCIVVRKVDGGIPNHLIPHDVLTDWLRAALTAAHAAGKREAYEKAIEVIDDDCWGEVIRNSLREAARDDGVELS